MQVLKVAILAEKYAVDYTWYVDTILNLIRIAGDYVSEEVWYRVIQIVINRDDVQGYAAKTVFEVRPSWRGCGRGDLLSLPSSILGGPRRVLRIPAWPCAPRHPASASRPQARCVGSREATCARPGPGPAPWARFPACVPAGPREDAEVPLPLPGPGCQLSGVHPSRGAGTGVSLPLRLCAAAVRAAAVGAGRGSTDHGALRGDAPGHAPCPLHSCTSPAWAPPLTTALAAPQALQAPACHENLVKVGGYILGEFGNLIAGDPRSR